MNEVSTQAGIEQAQSATDVHSRHGLAERSADGYSPFFPLLLLVSAVFLWSAFQAYQIFREGQAISAASENQQRQVDESAKLRGSLDAIARETALLADRGNAGARLIVDELRKRGVTISPNSPAQPGK